MDQDCHQTKAMVEVALALAMGFFSIMVLAMVSMGAGVGAAPATADLAPGVSVAGSAPNSPATREPGAPGPPVVPLDLIIFYEGRFLGADLRQVDPVAWRVGKVRPVLAVPPDLDFQAVIDARRRLGIDTVTVTSLDERWRARLRERVVK